MRARTRRKPRVPTGKTKTAIASFFSNSKISILHSGIDVVGLVYFRLEQKLIAALLFTLIVLNIWQASGSFVREHIRGIEKFSIGLFHSSFQLLPFALSLSYYNQDDPFINALFITICISFAYIIYYDSKKINSASDNNTRIHQIFALCIILDYINSLTLVLCKLYTANNYYYYKFILSSYPFCIGLGCAIVQWEHKNWSKIIKRCDFVTLRKCALGVWYLFILSVLYPIGMECVNATWIIFIYFEFLTKLRHSKRFNENLKDNLVQWLSTDKDDLLLKICIINHIQLIDEMSNKPLHTYLDSHCKNNKFYKNVSWNVFKNKSQKLKDLNLAKRIVREVIDYSKIRTLYSATWHRGTAFRNNQSWRTFMMFVEKLWELGSVIILSFYAMNCVLNVLVWPVITVVVMYNALNIHQMSFMVLYWLILSVVFYKLSVMINYERMMWYITPDLSDTKQTKVYKKYYVYIKHDFVRVRDMFADVLGIDVANIVLLYVPDFITEYDSKK